MIYETILQPLDISRVLDIYSPVPEHMRRPPRSPGIHLSGIIQALAKSNGHLKREETVIFGRSTHAAIEEEDLPMAMGLGIAWENFAALLYPCMFRPDEVEKDGVFMSPDGITVNCHSHLRSPESPVIVLEEFKLTWKSLSKPLEELWMYLVQVKAYCRAIGTRFCRLHICHVNGNYRFGDDPLGGPQYLVHHIEFADWELEDNWNMLLRNKSIAVVE